MNISAPFIQRPVATILVTIAIALGGALGYLSLPVSPLPQVDFPTIMVQAQLPGASPEVAATSLAEPLERHLGQIADVTELTSQSQTGQSRVILQFGLDRNIDGAAKDVQAAINAAQADLPTNLLSQPTYRKVNPADAPVLILTLTSKTLTRVQMYDAASTLLAQQLSQVSGVGQVFVSGSALPAVRVELDPLKLFHFGIGLEDVRSALSSADANAPKGAIDVGAHRWQIYTTDQASRAADYRDQVIAYRNGDALRLRDVAEVVDSAQDLRNLGLADGRPAVIIVVFRQPGANIIKTVDAVRAEVPKLKAAMPADMDINFASDRSTTIRNSLAETQRTLIVAMLLVVGRGVPVPAERPRRAGPRRRRSRLGRRHVRRHVSDELFARQSFPDGFDHLHRLRGRRRHRGAGEYFAPHGRGHAPTPGGAGWRARHRLHHRLHHLVADRRVHADPADGRPGRPAVPRIRHDAVDGHRHFHVHRADHDADDVRADPAAETGFFRAGAQNPVPAGRGFLRAHPGHRAAP